MLLTLIIVYAIGIIAAVAVIQVASFLIEGKLVPMKFFLQWQTLLSWVLIGALIMFLSFSKPKKRKLRGLKQPRGLIL